MRMKEIQFDSNGELRLDVAKLPASCVLIISEGKAKFTELPVFAETKIITHAGKVKRVKWDEGEEF